MVHINNRVFARSWYKKERSWFTAFREHNEGEINYGGKIIKVNAIKLDRKDTMHKKINKAYIEKYTRPGDVKFAVGFSDPGYADFTMEFIFPDHLPS